MTPLELFYLYHSFDDEDQRDNWYIDLPSPDKLALLDTRHMLESDPLITALCERGGVVVSLEPTAHELPAIRRAWRESEEDQ